MKESTRKYKEHQVFSYQNYHNMYMPEMQPRGNFWCNLCNVGAESAPPCWNRLKVSENLSVTGVAQVTPVVMSLHTATSQPTILPEIG